MIAEDTIWHHILKIYFWVSSQRGSYLKRSISTCVFNHFISPLQTCSRSFNICRVRNIYGLRKSAQPPHFRSFGATIFRWNADFEECLVEIAGVLRLWALISTYLDATFFFLCHMRRLGWRHSISQRSLVQTWVTFSRKVAAGAPVSHRTIFHQIHANSRSR